jgi:hypothetical protein|tara:strand:+ start:3704 stop:4339 length:636 start_codon:yes stop_codon:yes gene_type:complete
MGLFDSLKNIMKVAAPILGGVGAKALFPGMSPFLSRFLGGGIGSLATGSKPENAIISGAATGVGGNLPGNLGGNIGSTILSGAVPIAQIQQEEIMKKILEMYPDRNQEELRQLMLTQNVNAPTNYKGYEDIQVENNFIPKVANGGVMDLRAQGGMSLGPGTEKSDDIPAMLSDGEFVMTAKAVRGFGNGSRAKGAKNLYNMMDKAEGNVPS